MIAASRTFCALIVVLLGSVPAAAQTSTWTGASSVNWNTALNWSPNGVPTASSNVVFPAGVFITTPTLTSNGVAASLLFDAGTTNYTVAAGAGITLSGLNAITISASSSGLYEINFANIVSGNLLFPSGQNLTITNNMPVFSGDLTFGANTVIGTPGNGGVIFAVSGFTTYAGSFAASGTPDNRVVGGLTKNGPGTLLLSGNGANLTGGIRLNAGTLQLDYATSTALKFANSNALISAGGDIVIFPNASNFVTQNTDATTLTGGHTQVNFAGSGLFVTLGVAGITRSAGATIDFAGSPQPFSVTTTTSNTNGLLGTGPAFATIDGTRWARNNGSGALQSVTGTANFFMLGTNTELTASQTVNSITTNSLRFNNNLLTLTVDNTLTLESGGILVPAGVIGSTITGSAGGTVTSPGSGEILVHAYGPLTINSAVATSAGLTKTGPAELTLGGHNFFLTGPITVNRGGLRVLDKFAVNNASAINFTDNSARGNGAQTLTVELGDGVNGIISRPLRFTTAANGPNVFPNVITTGASNNSRVELTGVISSAPGTVTPIRFDGPANDSSGLNLLGVNTFTGTVRLSDGTLGINSNASLGDPVNRLEFDFNNASAGGLEFLNGGINLARPVELGSFNSRIVSNGSDFNTISGPLSGPGNGFLHKGGTGTLALTGPSTFTGELFIDAGTVRVNAAFLGSASVITINSQTTLAVTETATDASTYFLGTFGASPNAGTIDVAAGATFTVNGVVADNFGPGSLIKSGPGTLVLNSTSNSYSGGTTVRAGTLQAAADITLGTAGTPVMIETLGTLRFTGSSITTRTFNLLNGTLETPPGVTLALNGATVAGGFLRGGGTFQLTGGASLTGVTTFTNTNLNVTGAASISNFAHNGNLSVASGQTLSMNYGTNGSAGRMTVTGTANVTEFVSNGQINVPTGGLLNNSASLSGIVLGGGSTTFVGTPAVMGGIINVGTQPLLVRGGLLVNNGAIGNSTGNGQVIVDYGGFAKGGGFYDTLPITINGGRFSPGNSPGRVTVGSVNMTPGGIYDFEINNATGLAGPTGTTNLSGWDLTIVSNQINPNLSNLTVSATSATPFTINLVTLTNPSPPDVPGQMANFNPTQPFQWLAFDVNTAGSVVNWDPSAIVVNTSQFMNTFNGTFSLVRDTGNPFQFYISYTPVPEPATVLAVAFGGLIVGGAIRRRGAGPAGATR